MSNKKKRPLGKGILAGASLAAALGIAVLIPFGNDVSPASSMSVSHYEPVAAEKEFTLMVYMVGSDLESVAGAATDNINELKSINTENINIICESGGSLRWKTSQLTAEHNTRFKINDGEIIIDKKLPSRNMGLASTLADFIAYARSSYPAQKYILALWNHGDGPVGGFGSDELFANDAIMLNELSEALKTAGCEKEPLDIIGFDACCMASIETALCVAPYANYMIASQNIEPAGGWDYTVMGKLQGLSPFMAAKKVAGAYFNKAAKTFSATTVSVTDLSLVGPLAENITSLLPLYKNSYATFSQIRADMSSFGGDGRAQGQSDLVDLLSFLKETEKLELNVYNAKESLNNAVVLNLAAEVTSSGLSIYAPYYELDFAYEKLNQYKDNKIMPEYAAFASGFANYILKQQLIAVDIPPTKNDDDVIFVYGNNENIKNVFMTTWEEDEIQEGYYYMTGTDGSAVYDGEAYIYQINEEWTFLGGQPLCTLEIESEKGIYTKFACPILLNGNRANLILRYDRENPYGKIMYCVMLNDKQHFSKMIKPLFNKDLVTPLYPIEAFAADNSMQIDNYKTRVKGFKLGESFVFNSDMQLEALPASESSLYGFWFTTYQNNEYFSDFIQIS